MATHLIALFVTVEQETAIRELFSEKGWLFLGKDITTKHEVENAWKITLDIPQESLEISKTTEGVIEQDQMYVPVKVENDAVDHEYNPRLAHVESHPVYTHRDNDSDTSSTILDNADMEGIADTEQSGILPIMNGEPEREDHESSDSDYIEPDSDYVDEDSDYEDEDLDNKKQNLKRKKGRPRKCVDEVRRRSNKTLTTIGTKSSKTKKQQQVLPSFEDFKELVRAWPMNGDTRPEFFPQNVSYGTYSKPIEKPTDLDENFYSKSQNGYFCCNCSLLFKSSIKNFMKHRLKTDGKCYYECDICCKKYSLESGRVVHFKKVHSSIKPHVCDICGAAYRRKDKLNIHMQQHHNVETPFVCDTDGCKKAFKTKKGLYFHEKNVHVKESEKLLCSFCPKTFKARSSLQYHLQSHNDELKSNNWHCEKCGKSFRLEKLLKNHIKRHSQERRFCCHVCGKSFFQQHALKIHYVVHSGLKPFECHLCPYKCNIKWNLDKHMKTHLKLPS